MSDFDEHNVNHMHAWSYLTSWSIDLLGEPDLVAIVVDHYIIDTVELATVVVVDYHLRASLQRVDGDQRGRVIEVPLTAVQDLIFPMASWPNVSC